MFLMWKTTEFARLKEVTYNEVKKKNLKREKHFSKKMFNFKNKTFRHIKKSSQEK